MATPVERSQLHPGDTISIRSKKNNDSHDGCVFKVKSISSGGYVAFEIITIDDKPVKRAEKGLKPQGGYEQDFLFFLKAPRVRRQKGIFVGL